MRGRVAPAAAPTRFEARTITHRGRPAIELTGRIEAEEEPGPVRELGVFDLATGSLASYVYFPHASTRKAGEPIVSLAEISSRADALVRAVLPGELLALEGVQRFRVSGEESFYYEARYAPAQTEIPVLEAPVRLLLDASSGRLFRLDVDPDRRTPAKPPRPMITRQAAEKVAGALFRRLDLPRHFGEGAAFGGIERAELFLVRPNGWLGYGAEEPLAPPRAAWVVPFRLGGAASGRAGSLFLDAASGRPLGGRPADDAPAR